MSERFYRAVRCVGRGVFHLASRPLILRPERAAAPGPWILAANHCSPLDAPLLIAATPRIVYWLSIRELFHHRPSRWFMTAMLASPLDRQRVDTGTVRGIMRHLRAGRVVGLFPEGGVQAGRGSVLEGGPLLEGVAGLAELGRAPVLPCVVLGARSFHRWTSWLPLFRTPWAVAYGEPIALRRGESREAARTTLLAELRTSLQALHAEILTHRPELASAHLTQAQP